jgi:hypothetical protein
MAVMRCQQHTCAMGSSLSSRQYTMCQAALPSVKPVQHDNQFCALHKQQHPVLLPVVQLPLHTANSALPT